MRNINVNEITRNIKEMCIEANHFLTDDMQQDFIKQPEARQQNLERWYYRSLRKILKSQEKK